MLDTFHWDLGGIEAIDNVLANRTIEKDRLLRDQSDMGANVRNVEILEIFVVNNLKFGNLLICLIILTRFLKYPPLVHLPGRRSVLTARPLYSSHNHSVPRAPKSDQAPHASLILSKLAHPVFVGIQISRHSAEQNHEYPKKILVSQKNA